MSFTPEQFDRFNKDRTIMNITALPMDVPVQGVRGVKVIRLQPAEKLAAVGGQWCICRPAFTYDELQEAA